MLSHDARMNGPGRDFVSGAAGRGEMRCGVARSPARWMATAATDP